MRFSQKKLIQKPQKNPKKSFIKTVLLPILLCIGLFYAGAYHLVTTTTHDKTTKYNSSTKPPKIILKEPNNINDIKTNGNPIKSDSLDNDLNKNNGNINKEDAFDMNNNNDNNSGNSDTNIDNNNSDNNSENNVNINSDNNSNALVKYLTAMDELHNKKIDELEDSLKSRKLSQIIRFKFIQFLLELITKKDGKLPSDYDVAKIIATNYDGLNQEVNFIQVGACDGDWSKSNDPIQRLILTSEHWHGIMMEPVPYLFKKLEISVAKTIKDYKDRIHLLNAALSDRDGLQTFYTVNKHFGEEMPHETHALKHQIGSFNIEHIYKHLNVKIKRGQLKNDVNYYITPINVTSMTPLSVVNEFKKSGKSVRDGNIDILLIDAEGYDYILLGSFLDIPIIRPVLVVYEHLHLNEEDKKKAIKILESHGYITVGVGWNTFGVRVAEL